MRLLHVIASIDPKGGGPIEGVRQLKAALAPLGVKIDIACCDPPDATWINNSDFETVYAFGPSRFGIYKFTHGLISWLKKNAEKYDAIITNGMWQYNSFAVWLALGKKKTPYFVFTHGMLDPWFKRKYPLKHLKKWLYWPWGQYPVLRDAKAVIFTCEEERILARQSFWLYKANEAVTAYGTAGPPERSEEMAQIFLNRYPEMKEKRLILFLSRIHEKKGCDLLIDAFADIAPKDQNLRLIMAGPDQTGWAEELKAMARERGIEGRILWPGMLQGDLKWGAYYAAEAFCLPSHQENFGIVVAEALACGKPVLISNKVNIWREIEEEKAGFIAPDTKEGARQILTQWLALSPEECKAMSRRARACFENRFHIQKAAERLLEIIKGNV